MSDLIDRIGRLENQRPTNSRLTDDEWRSVLDAVDKRGVMISEVFRQLPPGLYTEKGVYNSVDGARRRLRKQARK